MSILIKEATGIYDRSCTTNVISDCLTNPNTWKCRFILVSESSASESKVKIHTFNLSNVTSQWISYHSNIETTQSGKLVLFKGNPIYFSFPKSKVLTRFILKMERNFSDWKMDRSIELGNSSIYKNPLCPVDFWYQRISAISQ